MQPADRQVVEDVEPPVRRLGKYELIARIGEGGMAEVHLARMLGPMNFQKVVVVKTIHPALVSQQEFLTMLFDEARLSALIKHPNVVDIYDLGLTADGTYFIAMEYLDGLPLSLVMTAGTKGHAIAPPCVARIVADAARGLHAAHELKTISGKAVELVHRDVSPGNVIVLYDGTVKIVDFGISKARGRLTTSGVRQLKGKLGYMSPEQITARPVDRRSDLFGLGAVMWEALALKRLFPGEDSDATLERILRGDIVPPSVLRPGLPQELDAICLRALAADPAKRYQTAGELADELDQLLRQTGQHRETAEIAAYMTKTFAKRRADRGQVLRRRAGTSGEVPSIPDFEVTPVSRTRETLGGAPKRSWPAITAIGGAVLAVGIAVGVLVMRSGRSSSPASPPAETVAPATTLAVSAPAPAPPAPAPAPAEPQEASPPPPVDPGGALPAPVTGPVEPAKPAKSAAELYREAGELFVQGKHEKAKEKFKAALAADPRHAPSHRGLGLVYQALGRKDRAVASFHRYLKLAPNAADAGSIRARIEALQD